jgi:hypothetical protein
MESQRYLHEKGTLAMPRRFMTKLLFLSLMSLGLVALFTPAAFAADPQQVSPQRIGCTAGYAYTNIQRTPNQLVQIGPTYRDYNGSSKPATVTLTSTVSGTVTFSVTAGFQAEANFIFGAVKSSLNVSISVSLTATFGNTIVFSVPAKKAGYGDYGVWEVVTTGTLYYVTISCQYTYLGTVQFFGPSYVGWTTWIGN